MELITGGAYQGKLAYAKRLFPGLLWADGAVCGLEEAKTAGGVCNFQELIRRLLLEDALPERLAEELYEANPKLVLVSDEVGCGVVPAEAFDRNYREAVGRICTALAEKSVRVHRVLCGIGMILKDEK